jgi:phosphatidylcholine synthase
MRTPSVTGLAYLVHLYTATGAVWGLLALRAVVRDEYRGALLWLLLATIVDATDGWLARRVRVDRHARLIIGARLDDIVDYLTYVVVPAFLLLQAGALPAGVAGLLVAAAMLLSSALGFSRADAKTADYYFTGFPSYWNVVALYALVLRSSPAVNAVLLTVLSALVFVPIRYVYPSRTPTLRPLTTALSAIWSVQVALMIAWLEAVPAWLFWSSLAFPVYYLAVSLWLNARRPAASAQGSGTEAD